MASIALAGCGGGGQGSSAPQPTTEVVNGMTVPLAPDTATNNRTVSGIDSDSDGIRDDVQRAMATQFGSTHTKIELLKTFARTEQAVLNNPTPQAVGAYMRSIGCTSLTAAETDKLTGTLLNTPERSAAYRNAMAGATWTGEEC